MEQKFSKSAHAKFENREYLKMRGRNPNFEFKFEIFIKFRVEWYIMIIGFICSCTSFNWIQDCVGVESKFLWKLLLQALNLLLLYTLRCGIWWQFRIFIWIFDSAHAFWDICDFQIFRGEIRYFVICATWCKFETWLKIFFAIKCTFWARLRPRSVTYWYAEGRKTSINSFFGYQKWGFSVIWPPGPSRSGRRHSLNYPQWPCASFDAVFRHFSAL